MKSILRFLKPYIQKNKGDIIFYIVVTVLLWGIGIFTPYISGIYVDLLIAKKGTFIIIYFVILIAMINGINILIQYLTALISTKLNNKLLHQINSNIYQQIFCSRLSKYKDIDKACLVDQISNDSAALVGFFSENVVNFVLKLATIIVSGIIVLKADILLCVIIFSLIPIYILTYIGFRNKLYAANLKYKTQTNEYFSKKAEQINKLEFIKRNMVMDEMYNRFFAAFQLMYHVSVSQVKANYFFSNLNQFVLIICYTCVIGIGGYKVFIDKLSIGFFTIINTYFSMIISSTAYFLSLAGVYENTKVSIDRINKIYDIDHEIYGTKKISDANIIELKSLSVRYNSGNVINDLSYTFEKGKIYAIRGDNGSGKTTMLNCIIGLYTDLCTGEILYDTIPITRLDMPYLRRAKISFVEQSPEFLNLSIEEYLSFGLDMNDDINRKQFELIKKFELNKFVTHSDINESGNNFSGGEKQKLSIVRALSKQGFLTILDEPTSALDSSSVDILINLLQEQKENKITLVVSHDSRILDICDSSLEM